MSNMAEEWSQIGGHVGFENRLEQSRPQEGIGSGFRGLVRGLRGARISHGGREIPKVPPGPGFRVYIDRLGRAAGSRSEVVKGPGRPGRQAGQQTGMAGPAPGGGRWRLPTSYNISNNERPGGSTPATAIIPWTFSKEKHNTTPKIKKW